MAVFARSPRLLGLLLAIALLALALVSLRFRSTDSLTGSDVLHLGDVFFNGLYSFFDASSGGRFDGMIAALAVGLELAGPETRIIPGHGPLATRADLTEHHDRLVEIRERTLAAIAAGQSKADFIAGNPTADLAAAFEGSYEVMKADRFLDLVYEDLAP